MKRISSLLTLTISLFLITVFFQACGQRKYNTSLTCQELSTTLKREISVPQGDFDRYSDDELNFFFSSPQLYDDAYIVYSTDNTDICELGILHAANEENAKMLFEDAKGYIKELQEQKSDFLRNYSPEELIKLNSAEVRRYGNYIIFTVAEQGDKNEVFKKAEMILTE